VNVGYIGPATDGTELAARLDGLHPVAIYDPAWDGSVELPAVPPAVTVVTEAGAVAAVSKVILLRLDSAAEVREVLLGDGGIAATAQAGTLIIDQSPGDPAATRAAAAALAGRQVGLIDAPVLSASGPDTPVIVAVGGSAEQFEIARPILEAAGARAAHAGEVGAGLVVKAAHSLICGMLRCAALEALALAVKSGLRTEATIDVLLASSGQNSYLRTAARSSLLAGRFDAGGQLGTVQRDVAQACDLASSSGVPLFVGNNVRAFYQACVGELGAQAGADAAGLVMDRLADSLVVPAPAAGQQETLPQPEGYAANASH
jgi:3-hydroxyisobutyrate dehydrogenase